MRSVANELGKPSLGAAASADEAERLSALFRYDILNTAPEESFDRLVRLAARFYEVPIAFVSLVDSDRQWFKSCMGVSETEMAREVSFCTHVVESSEVLVVTDATADPRFCDNPLVTGPLGIRFYAGAPLRTSDGFVLGALAIIDVVPRSTPPDTEVLAELAAVVSDELELRHETRAREEAQTALRARSAALEELGELLDLTDDSVMVRDLDGTIRYWNGGAERTYGWTRGEAVGKSSHVLLGTVFPEPLDAIHEAVQRDGHWRGELRHTTRDGRSITVNSRWALRCGEDGQPSALLEINSDVTIRKEAEAAMAAAKEEAERANRAKTEFLANMSHEIRTPMNGVMGMSGLLLDTDLSPLQREYAQTVRNSAEALLEVINEILDFSKVEAGKIELEVIDFDLRSAVEDVAGLLGQRAQEKGLELITLVHPDVPAAVRGDPGRLRQILVNLVGNAVKFTDAGEIVIQISLEKDDGEQVALRIEVTDTGVGIPVDRQGALFDAFSQADPSTTRRFGGTGLGLAISKRLVTLMGGDMGVDSSPGEGSCFWFTVRLGHGEEAASATPAGHRGLDGLRTLVVDDNDTNRRVLEQTLLQWGMRPGTAEAGERALEMLRTAAAGGKPYDLAILDYHMPGMDGMDLARAIRADTVLRDLPLVLLTSSAKKGDATEAAAAGLQAFLTKPIKLSALHDALVSVMALEPPSAVAAPLVTRFTLAASHGKARARVLIAEDNVVNQKVASRFLEKLGYRADVAANGKEAVAAVATGRYDAVLMDCQMPEMDGYEATQAIRTGGMGRRIPVIAMTAGAMSWEREKCIAAGMDDFLTKPVRIEALAETLERWLGEEGEKTMPSDVPSADLPSEEGAGVDVPSDESAAVDVPSEEGAAVDEETIAMIRNLDAGDEGLLAELVDLFVTNAGLNLVRLEDAVSAGDEIAVREIAHSLKGSSANIGAKRMARMCAELEGMIGEWSRVTAAVDRIRAEFAVASAALVAEADFPQDSGLQP